MNLDPLQRMRTAFRIEAVELLAELDSALLSLEADPANNSLVHRAFRAVHTVKGTGATAGFTHLASFAHTVEEVLDLARAGKLEITGELVDCALKACDILRAIITSEQPEAEIKGEDEVAESLRRILPSGQQGPEKPGNATTTAALPSNLTAFDILFRPKADFFFSGSDPVTLLDELRELGHARVSAHTEEIPTYPSIEPESCYLWWEIKLVTAADESRIRQIFSFVEDKCDVILSRLYDQSSALALIGKVPSESLDIFLAECREHLQVMESEALELEHNRFSRENLDALFRAVHSLKGNAALLMGQIPRAAVETAHPLPVLVRIAHATESVLDGHRTHGGSPVSSETAALVLDAHDVMARLLENLAGSSEEFVLPTKLLEKLETQDHQPSALLSPEPDPASSAFQNIAKQSLELFESCLRQLEKEPEGTAALRNYSRGLKTLSKAAGHQNRGDLKEPLLAQLRILEAAIKTGAPLTPEEHSDLSQSVQAVRAIIEATPGKAPRDPGNLHQSPPDAKNSAGTAPVSSTIRIDQDKLDRLMRVVGELLVAKGSFANLLEMLWATDDKAALTRNIRETGTSISRIAEELQASVMSIRMLPVRTVFQRFPRLVRDLARNLGKEVQLNLHGETVELDKTILEQIADPLVHLVRNAIDHGIERPEHRQRHGKPITGQLTLRASNEAGNVVIEITDDGRGLNADALKRKAVSQELITAEAASLMSNAEAYRLVFLPGLSTAEKITDVSGRGVGMDVVYSNIKSLGGAVDIRSTAGEGAVFSIKLPTSLIVSKGILLEAGRQQFILPLTSIQDMVKLPALAVHDFGGRRIAQVRGQVYSVFSLAQLFDLQPNDSDELSLAIVASGKLSYGLIVDRFVSQVEVLVKPLAGGLENRREFHGAAIMSDGRAVLVLNPFECHQLSAEACA